MGQWVNVGAARLCQPDESQVVRNMSEPTYKPALAEGAPHRKRYGMVIDLRRCIGCHSCSVACKVENDVPLGV